MNEIPGENLNEGNLSKRESALEQVARWVPEEQKTHFWKTIAHFDNLSADDEILKLAEVMGF
jgi:hypothetical protein